MKSIYKYVAMYPDFGTSSKRFNIEMPTGAQILSVAIQHGVPVLWAMVDTRVKTVEQRHFMVYGTGASVRTDEAYEHIGTVEMDMGGNNFAREICIWHYFEIVEVI